MFVRRIVPLLVPGVCAVALIALIRNPAPAQPAAKAGSGPQIAGCPVFPDDNVWNAPIDKLPVDAHSAEYIKSMGAAAPLHADFASDPGSGIPYSVTDSKVPWIKVPVQYADDSDPGLYPIPPNAIVEGGSDHHVIVVDKDDCLLSELFEAQRTGNGWKADGAVKFDLTSNGLRSDGKSSVDAAGLPMFPGLVRYDEVTAGEIKHALRFTVPKTQQAHIWPARHDASRNTDTKLPPLGIRVRLRADFDISGFSKADQVILTALKRYGMFLADNGAAWFVSGAPDPHWNDDDLHTLNRVKGSDFEVVDESSLMYVPDSGRVNPVAGK